MGDNSIQKANSSPLQLAQSDDECVGIWEHFLRKRPLLQLLCPLSHIASKKFYLFFASAMLEDRPIWTDCWELIRFARFANCLPRHCTSYWTEVKMGGGRQV